MENAAGDAPYHAHVYYSPDERSAAAALREKLRTAPADDPLSALLFVGELRDHKTGPHITSQFEITSSSDCCRSWKPNSRARGCVC